MGVTINLKHPCNTIGSLTNKGKKQEQIILPSDRIAITYNDIGVIVLRPAIDRLTFGFLPDEKLLKKYKATESIDEYQDAIKASLAGDGFQTNITGLSYVKGVSFFRPPYADYNINLNLKPCPDSEDVLIQVSPKKKGFAFLRFDMNPNRMTAKGMARFWEIIDDILVMPSAIISREDFLIWSKINSIEIAVDILGARPSDLAISSFTNYKPKPQKSHAYKSSTGRVQTVYPKLKAGSAAEYIYDKRQERLDLGHEPIFGDFLHSRFEFRVQKTTFFKLAKINNRCERISIRSLNLQKFGKLKYTQQLFVRYVLARTLDKALEVIPEKHQGSYKAAHEAVMQKIWEPKKIWSFWPDTLSRSGFFQK